MYVCVCVYIYTCIYIHAYICIFMCVCVCVCMPVLLALLQCLHKILIFLEYVSGGSTWQMLRKFGAFRYSLYLLYWYKRYKY
jgi:hypothetical protein